MLFPLFLIMNDLELQGMRTTDKFRVNHQKSSTMTPAACMHMAHLALPQWSFLTRNPLPVLQMFIQALFHVLQIFIDQALLHAKVRFKSLPFLIIVTIDHWIKLASWSKVFLRYLLDHSVTQNSTHLKYSTFDDDFYCLVYILHRCSCTGASHSTHIFAFLECHFCAIAFVLFKIPNTHKSIFFTMRIFL